MKQIIDRIHGNLKGPGPWLPFFFPCHNLTKNYGKLFLVLNDTRQTRGIMTAAAGYLDITVTLFFSEI